MHAYEDNTGCSEQLYQLTMKVIEVVTQVVGKGKHKQKLHDPKEFSFHFDKNNHTTHKANIQMNMHLKTPHCFPLTMKDNIKTISTI